MSKIHVRALTRQIKTSAYIEEMFETGHDVANRQVFMKHHANTANIVGVALRGDRRQIDKITKGAGMDFSPAQQ